MSYIVSDVFSYVVAGGWIGKGQPVWFGDEVPSPTELEDVSLSHMQTRGLVAQQRRVTGRTLITEGGVTLERQRMYAIADVGDVREAARGIVNRIADKHGPGRVWIAAPLGYLNRRMWEGLVETRIQGVDNSDRDEPYVFTPTGDGTPKILLGVYYFHEASGRKQTIDEELERVMANVSAPGWRKQWVQPVTFDRNVDPLDQVIDGQTLRYLIATDESMQRSDEAVCRRRFTPAQRAAVSAHRSDVLRRKVEAKRKDDAAAAPSVRYCEVEPWE